MRSDIKTFLFNCSNNISCTIYKRDAVDVLCDQVKNTKMKYIIHHYSERKTRIRSFSFDVDAKECEAVETALK